MYIMKRKYKVSVIVEHDKDGYFAFSPELQGCYTQGDTYEEVMANIKDAIKLHLEDRLEIGEVIPEINSVCLASLEVEV